MFDVSIIIPTYNRCRLVSQAIDSCLQQSDKSPLKLEVLVVDDCSTDDTAEMLRSYGELIRPIFLPRNAGQCAARNAGLTKATARYVKFLDSDDVLENGTLSKEIEVADKECADIVVLSWGTVEMDGAGQAVGGTEKLWPVPDMNPLPDSVLRGRAVPTTAALYKRTYVEGLQWDAAVRKLDDWDWFCQVALRRGNIVSLDAISYWMREHKDFRVTNSSNMLVNARDHHLVLRKIEGTLRANGELTHSRAKRLAQYYYKELRVLSLFDRPSFDSAVEHIHSLDPLFTPVEEERDWYMRLLGKVLGIKRTILLHSFAKRKILRRGRVS